MENGLGDDMLINFEPKRLSCFTLVDAFSMKYFMRFTRRHKHQTWRIDLFLFYNWNLKQCQVIFSELKTNQRKFSVIMFSNHVRF